MGWVIEKLEDGRFNIHHSVNDAVSGPYTRDEILLLILESRMERLISDFVRECMAFPFHWGDLGMRIHMDGEDGHQKFSKWALDAMRDDSRDYDAEIRKRFLDEVRGLEERTGNHIGISFGDREEIRKFYDHLSSKLDLVKIMRNLAEVIETREAFPFIDFSDFEGQHFANT